MLTEVSAILEHLAECAPDRRLLPKTGSMERYRVQEWVGFIGTELHKWFDPLSDGLMPDAARRLAVQYLRRRLSYLVGDESTVADAYCFTILNWARFHRIDLSEYGAVQAFMQNVSNRPMVHKAMKAEGLRHAA
nr:glutathione binding-like protein [Microvirga vignae]